MMLEILGCRTNSFDSSMYLCIYFAIIGEYIIKQLNKREAQLKEKIALDQRWQG